MNPITHIVCFAVRQTCGVCVKDVAAEIEKYYRDHSAALPRAIERATEQAWRALAVALAGDGWVDRVKIAVTASGDEKAFREQVKKFLDDGPLNLAGQNPERFRRDCLIELTTLRRDRTLLAAPPPDAVARTATDFSRFDAPAKLIGEAERAATGVADALAPRFPNLAELLRTPPPLLAIAFAYFFRKAVTADDELFDAIQHDAIQSLTAGQLAGFQNLDKALRNIEDGFDDALDQAVVVLSEQIEKARLAAEAAEREARLAAEQAKHAATAAAGAERAALGTQDEVRTLTAAVLDLPSVLAKITATAFPDAVAIRQLVEDVIRREHKAGMMTGSLRPHDSLSIRGDDERRAIRQLLDHYRQLPADERQQVPALLNGLGKLLHGAGDFPEARRAFAEVAELVPDAAARSEVLVNAYRTALEEKKYGEALAALRDAVALDGRRAPFPMERFEPVEVLGAGGFGTVFRCRDRNFRGREVAVKALHADDLDRGIDEVFAEAHALIDFTDPAVIRVRDAEFADRGARRGPYLVMEYFPGTTLADYVVKPGPIPPAELLPLARRVAAGLARVHQLDILHRDLKPDNILVRRDAEGWQVRVIDFGLAIRRDQMDTQAKASSTEKSLQQASIVGTMRFAPPEQRGELPADRVGRWSDVYGFGRTFLHAWFGVPQPGRKVRAGVADAWRPLFDLLEECVEHEPGDRPQNFEEVLKRLDQIGAPSAPTTHSTAVATSPPAATVGTERGEQATKSASSPASTAAPPTAPTEGPTASSPTIASGPPPDRDLDRAEDHYRSGRRQDAVAGCDAVLAAEPDNVRALALRSKVHRELGRWEQAVADAHAAVNADRHSARIAVPDDQTDNGDETDRSAVGTDGPGPNPNLLAVRASALFMLSQAKGNWSIYADAVGDVLRALELAPAVRDRIIARATLDVDSGGYPDLVQLFAKPEWHVFTGKVADFVRVEQAVQEGSWQAVLANLSHLGYDGNPVIGDMFSRIKAAASAHYRDSARQHAVAGRHQAAVADMTTAIEWASEPAPMYIERAECHLQLAHHEQAVGDAAEALRLRPGDPRATRLKADAEKLLAEQSRRGNEAEVDYGTLTPGFLDSAVITSGAGDSAPGSSPSLAAGVTCPRCGQERSEMLGESGLIRCRDCHVAFGGDFSLSTEPDQIVCPGCDRQTPWRAELAGKKVKCQCGERFQL